jgi:hypothetical protein
MGNVWMSAQVNVLLRAVVAVADPDPMPKADVSVVAGPHFDGACYRTGRCGASSAGRADVVDERLGGWDTVPRSALLVSMSGWWLSSHNACSKMCAGCPLRAASR